MNLENLRNLRLSSIRQNYTSKDSILYALGLGYGTNPLSAEELQFVYEKDQKAVPSQSVVLGYPGFWMQKPELSVDWVKLLHGEHYFEIHQPLKPKGTIRSEHTVSAVDDKGEEKGALVYVEKKLYDEADVPVATIRQTLFLRGDGGCGSFGLAPAPAPTLPDRPADASIDIPTVPQLALIYRLSGDFNPVHADPVVAANAGFDRPILMGLCTMGLATRAAITVLLGGQPELLRSMFVRFSKPVFPGETIRFAFYRHGNGETSFSARSLERNVLVLDRCQVRFKT